MNKLFFRTLLAGALAFPAVSFGRTSNVRIESMMELSSRLNDFAVRSRKASGGIALATAALMIMPEFSQCDVMHPIIFYYIPGYDFIFSCHLRPGVKAEPIYRDRETLKPFPLSGNRVVFAPGKDIADRIKAEEKQPGRSGSVVSAELIPDKSNTAFIAQLASKDRTVSSAIESLLKQASMIFAELKFPQKDTVSLSMQIHTVPGSRIGEWTKHSIPAVRASAYVLKNRTGISILSVPMDLKTGEAAAVFAEQQVLHTYKVPSFAASAGDLVRETAGRAVLSFWGDDVLADIPLKDPKKIRLPENIFSKNGTTRVANLGRRLLFVQFTDKSVLLYFTRKNIVIPALDKIQIQTQKNTVMQSEFLHNGRSIPFSKITVQDGKFLFEATAKDTMPDSMLP